MLREPECHCGHVRSSHHEGKHCCLAMRCDCTRYRDSKIPAAKPADIDWLEIARQMLLPYL